MLFDTDGGLPVPPPQALPVGAMVECPINPVRGGYAFAGWYTEPEPEGEIWIFDVDMVDSDLTLHARWMENE